MRAAKLILNGFMLVPVLFCVSCRNENVRTGPFNGAAGVRQVRRILILPFPRDRKDSDTFYDLASEELWKNKVIPKKDVYAEYVRLELDPDKAVLSKDQAVLISSRLGADVVVVGYRDAESVLHVKVVDLAARAILVREQNISASDGVRRFVERRKHDFKNFEEICAKKGIKGTSKGASGDPGARFVNKGAAKPSAAEGVGVSTAAVAVSTGPVVKTEVLDVKINIDAFEDNNFHDFGWDSF